MLLQKIKLNILEKSVSRHVLMSSDIYIKKSFWNMPRLNTRFDIEIVLCGECVSLRELYLFEKSECVQREEAQAGGGNDTSLLHVGDIGAIRL